MSATVRHSEEHSSSISVVELTLCLPLGLDNTSIDEYYNIPSISPCGRYNSVYPVNHKATLSQVRVESSAENETLPS